LHRDLKLANLLLKDGYVKIADFGFSRLLNADDMATTMLGSPLNCAPEILKGKEYDNKVDIWSIGTVFYEMIFGKPPFNASNINDLLDNIN
jgi:serine/threonine-protein kinase ULK/ATG1